MSTSTATFNNDILVSGELIPAEVGAAIEREAKRSPLKIKTNNTINDQGHINIYAVEPATSPAAELTEDQKFRLGVLFAIVTWVPIAIAYFVS